MVVDVVEQVETDPADGLLSHDRLVQDPAEDVRDDGGRVLHRLADRYQLLHLQNNLRHLDLDFRFRMAKTTPRFWSW